MPPKTKDPEGKVVIGTDPEGTPAVEPKREPADPDVKKLLDQIVGRLTTAESEIVKGTTKAERQRGDLVKLRDFILEDVTLSMDALASKAKAVNLPAKMESPKLDVLAAMSSWMPLDSLFDFLRGSKHGKEKSE